MKHKRTKKPDKPNGIILDEKFKIRYLDDDNLELQELINVESKDKETEEITINQKWEGKGYYRSISSIINAYYRIKQNRCKSIDELLDTMEDLHEKTDNLFKVKTKDCKCKKDQKH